MARTPVTRIKAPDDWKADTKMSIFHNSLPLAILPVKISVPSDCESVPELSPAHNAAR